MPSPIRIPWRSRPGVSEYGAWRVHGGHDGFDTYTLPHATIYGTASGGVVIGKGYAAGGWGHYIDVRYPGYTQRDCHMAEASGLRVGAPVGTGTALGRVGQTGNAKGIAWWYQLLKAWLWHVHSEVYLARSVVFAKRTNPLPVWGVTTAGGDYIPIGPDPVPEFDYALQRRQREDNMYVQHENPKYPQVYKTFDDANGHLRMRYCNANEAAIALSGGLVLPVNDATLTNLGIEAGFKAPGIIPLPKVDAGSGAGAGDLGLILDALAKIPTAEQNGQAARDHIVVPK